MKKSFIVIYKKKKEYTIFLLCLYFLLIFNSKFKSKFLAKKMFKEKQFHYLKFILYVNCIYILC